MQDLPCEIVNIIALQNPHAYYTLTCIFGIDRRLEAAAQVKFALAAHKKLFKSTVDSINRIKYVTIRDKMSIREGGCSYFYIYSKALGMNYLSLTISTTIKMPIEPHNWYVRSRWVKADGKQPKQHNLYKYKRIGGMCKVIITTNDHGKQYELYDDNLNRMPVPDGNISSWRYI